LLKKPICAASKCNQPCVLGQAQNREVDPCVKTKKCAIIHVYFD
jgi:hypothetical protein